MKFLLWLSVACMLQAEVFIREYTYNASENDSKVMARKAALRQLQLLVIEEVGVSVRSNFFKDVKLNGQTVQKNIHAKYESFSQAITKSKILKEKWDGEKFYIKVEITVDPQSVAKTIDNFSQPTVKDKKRLCKLKSDSVKQSLNDLSAKNINIIVSDVVKHPFKLPCNRWHFDIIYKFLRYDVSSDSYRKFLLKELAKINYPAGDKRAAYIIDYLRISDGITQDEWPTVLNTLKHMSTYRMYGMIRTIFSRHNSDTIKFMKAFLDEAKNAKVGLPKPFAYSKLAAEVVSTLERQEGELFEEYYEYYQDAFEAKEDKQLYHILKKRYIKDVSAKKMKLLVNYFKRQKVTAKLANQLFDFIKQLQRESQKSELFALEIEKFVQGTSELISKSFPLFKYQSEKEERIKMLFHLNVSSSMLPTAKECAKMLFDKSSYKQLEYAKYLALMGKKALSVEKKILKRLRRLKRESINGATNIEWALIETLGGMKTTSSEAQHYLIEALSSRRHKVPDYAKQALKKLGLGAVKNLLAAYKTQEVYVKIRIIEVLGASKKESAEVLSFLKGIKSTNSWIKDAVEDALEG